MGQSLSQLYIHLIFGTKGRHPFIKEGIREELNAYIVGTLKAYNCPSLRTNCVEDHVHVLFRLSKNMALAKVVEEVKKQSSKWMKTVKGGNESFGWQNGYAAFSVSSSKVDVVRKYILNQEAHHKKQTFREEVESFLREYDVIEYDEQYFWK